MIGGACTRASGAANRPDMKFDVYGQFLLEVVRENDRWVIYRIGVGLRALDSSVVIPSSLESHEIADYLDDLFHEACGPGQNIRLIP